MRRFFGLAVAVFATVALAQTQSSEVTRYLQAATTLYENLEYAKALAQVQKAKTKARTPDDEARCSVLEGVVPRPLGQGEFWNVNFPHPVEEIGHTVPDFVDCAIDPSPLPLGYESAADGWRYRSRYHERARVPGGDVETCFGGRIAVSRGRVV
jgi:hypothetical protein